MGVSEVCIEKVNGGYWQLCPKAKIIKTTETMILVSCDKKICLRKITAKIRQQAKADRTS